MRAYFIDEDLNRFADRLADMGSLEVGDTVRIDHDKCSDRRARGYITRKHGRDGIKVIDLFYCHNCGAADARAPIGARMPVTAPPREALREKAAEEPVTLPYDSGVVASMPDTPPHIVSWATEYGVADKVLWSPSMERIIMPVCDFGSGALLGYQARRDPAGSTRIPKYITVASRDNPLRLLVRPDALLYDAPSTVVIVEDWISAHQFRHLPSVWGAALLGLNASAEHLLWIDKAVQEHTGCHPRYVIWLDNDVKKSFEVRDYLQRLMMAIGRRSHVVGHLKDPKNTTELVLSTTVEHAFT